jgi:hypothetical protein
MTREDLIALVGEIVAGIEAEIEGIDPADVNRLAFLMGAKLGLSSLVAGWQAPA